MAVNYVVEGDIDAAVARRLIDDAGLEPGTPYICQCSAKFDVRIKGYNAAAVHNPWLALRDQDNAPCAAGLRQKLVPCPSQFFCFRIVPRQIEAWLMGDVEAISKFLAVRKAAFPDNPEGVANAKRALVDAARKSTKPSKRSGMVPREGSGINIGPDYAALMLEFIANHWSPERAARRCPALAKTRLRLSELPSRPVSAAAP